MTFPTPWRVSLTASVVSIVSADDRKVTEVRSAQVAGKIPRPPSYPEFVELAVRIVRAMNHAADKRASPAAPILFDEVLIRAEVQALVRSTTVYDEEHLARKWPEWFEPAVPIEAVAE